MNLISISFIAVVYVRSCVYRHRLAAFEAHKGRCPITMVKFNPLGNMMFYAMSYDWCKGAEHNDPKVIITQIIFLHFIDVNPIDFICLIFFRFLLIFELIRSTALFVSL